jgi:Ergosterol biosynthesis ERG4/ERG24 family
LNFLEVQCVGSISVERLRGLIYQGNSNKQPQARSDNCWAPARLVVGKREYNDANVTYASNPVLEFEVVSFIRHHLCSWHCTNTTTNNNYTIITCPHHCVQEPSPFESDDDCSEKRHFGKMVDTTTTTATAATVTAANWSGGAGILPGRETIGPIVLMLLTPIFSIVYFHVGSVYGGDFQQFVATVYNNSNNSNNSSNSNSNSNNTGGEPLYLQIYHLWPNPWDTYTWQMIGCFTIFQLILLRIVPGQRFVATTTPSGHRPIYTANGMACYILTLLSLMILNATTSFRAADVYDKFGNILSSMNVLALMFCTMLVVKGYVAPSGLDSGTTGSIVQDFYWGMELYPRIAGWDVKQFTNCRMGMMFWAVAIVSFCYKNMEVHDGQLQYGLAVSVVLQLVYISKFFYWEMGYMCRSVSIREYNSFVCCCSIV